MMKFIDSGWQPSNCGRACFSGFLDAPYPNQLNQLLILLFDESWLWFDPPTDVLLSSQNDSVRNRKESCTSSEDD